MLKTRYYMSKENYILSLEAYEKAYNAVVTEDGIPDDALEPLLEAIRDCGEAYSKLVRAITTDALMEAFQRQHPAPPPLLIKGATAGYLKSLL